MNPAVPANKTFAKKYPGLNNKILIPALTAMILFQVIVLGSVYINAVLPLWRGKEILLKTIPIDPRSLFRGNYARLRYEISRIPAKEINSLQTPRKNEPVYVTLIPGANGIYHYGSVRLYPPDSPIFIKGRIQNSRPVTTGTYRVTYGIEAWFAPREKAIALEKKLRNTGIATVYITNTGKAALKEIRGN